MTLLLATFHWLTQRSTGWATRASCCASANTFITCWSVWPWPAPLPCRSASRWATGAKAPSWWINLFNLGRAIPSLGLILLCIIVFGFNDIPVLAALIALSIPPILTNTWVGIYHADRPLCDAAIALA
ncbi:quaternary amine uptake ABC transporter (QAT) family, permease [Klebsiella variicola]|uniref:Quaternary amine uptake ABC transporter (QAT) family, permease n=1 Tax=Klebsiella variicola TaxID=244366 RepID=A0A7H4MMP9_KLEVA|nr:quaternary amine uptake ABC transporter (QAT) family, permease [Klebsiella variicola]